MRACVRLARAALALALPLAVAAQGTPERRNAFGDPFFRLSAAIAACPVPAGPFVTDDERRVQAHQRAERGTSCWLAGRCERPNFYAYDADIAAGVRAALEAQPRFADSSLWVMVQGRVVYIEGCVRDPGLAPELEAAVRVVPEVQQAVAAVYTDLSQRAPYRRLDAP